MKKKIVTILAALFTVAGTTAILLLQGESPTTAITKGVTSNLDTVTESVKTIVPDEEVSPKEEPSKLKEITKAIESTTDLIIAAEALKD